ncbi:collagen binding domain-containing protein [Listeria monocytogenes]|nr:collagen binding domain-containing protein [Listeria monocytogenes]
MKYMVKWRGFFIVAIIGLLVFQNVSPVLATIVDEKTTMITLKIIKEDKDTKEKINGSSFEIKNKKTGETKEVSITEHGTIIENSLSEGEYIVKEKKAAPGYTLDEQTYNVTLADKEEAITSSSTKKEAEKTPSVTEQPSKKGNLKAVITDNIFTAVKVENGTGNELGATNRIKNGGAVVLKMNFTFSGKNYKAGDTFKTVLPDSFNFGTTNLTGDFLPSTEAKWDLNASTRELTITFFKDGVQEGNYDIELSTALKSFSETEKTSQVAVFNTAGGNTVYQLEIIPEVDKATQVMLEAMPSKVNPDKATVDARFNLTKETSELGELRLSDTAYGGSTIINRNSIKVYSTDISAKGTFIGSKQLLTENTDYELIYAPSGLTIKLKEGLKAKGYQVTYERSIDKTNSSLSTIGTSATTVGSSGMLSNGSMTISVTIKAYDHLIKKAVYNPVTQCIDWTINVNYDLANLTPGTVLTDVLTDDNVSYVADSLKIKRVTFNEESGEAVIGDDASNDWTVSTISDNGSFNMNYKKTDEKAYQVTYSTKLTDFSPRKIKNEVTDEKGVKATENFDFKPDLLNKEAGEIDYYNNTMDWTITVNSEGINMQNINIVDEFSTGVKSLVSYNVYAYPSDSGYKLLTEGRDFTIQKDVSPAGFKIKLIGNYATTDNKIVVKMKTKIDLTDGAKTLDNKASFSYFDGSLTQYSETIKAEATPETSILANGGKVGKWNPATGEINWIVSVNAMGKKYDKLVLDDEFLDGTTFVEGSLQYRNVVNSSELTDLSIPLEIKGTLAQVGDANYPTKIDTSANKIHLEFGNLDTNRVFVKYKTKPKDNWFFSQWVNNKAIVSDNGADEQIYETKEFAFLQNEVIKVAGNIDNVYGNKVNWNMELLNISPERTLSNPVITNRLEQGNTGAQFIKNSFQVINTKTNEPINEENYDIIFEGNTFTIQFKNYTAMAPIKVSYSTISLLSGPISNETTVEAEDFSNVPMFFKKRNAAVSPVFTVGSGSGIATIGTIKITKVDEDDTTKKLEGAKFQLYTLDGEKSGQEIKTNSEGEILLDGIQSGKYKLVETEAPEGYNISDEYKEGKEITVNSSGEELLLTIKNAMKKGKVILTKKDSASDEVLADAEFELQNAAGSKLKEKLTTAASGNIEITDLAPGDYKLIETKAPAGYQLNATPVHFTIDFNQSEAAKVSKTNTAKTGTVVLTKKDSATNAKLADATFELRNEGGTVVRENLVTDDNGEISVADLAPGDYKLIETKAPTGYQLDAAPVHFTIDFNQTEAANVTKTNKKKIGTIIVKFIDVEGNQLNDEEMHTGNVDEEYNVKAKEIVGYTLVKDSANKKGMYKETSQEITFVYEKKAMPIIVEPTEPSKPTEQLTESATVAEPKPIKQNFKTTNKSTNNKRKLPSTGDEFPYTMLFIGLFVSVAGVFFLKKPKQIK